MSFFVFSLCVVSVCVRHYAGIGSLLITVALYISDKFKMSLSQTIDLSERMPNLRNHIHLLACAKCDGSVPCFSETWPSFTETLPGMS